MTPAVQTQSSLISHFFVLTANDVVGWPFFERVLPPFLLALFWAPGLLAFPPFAPFFLVRTGPLVDFFEALLRGFIVFFGVIGGYGGQVWSQGRVLI